MIYSFKQLKKACKIDITEKVRRIAVVGNVSTQFLSKAVEGYGKLAGFNTVVFDGDYNSIELQLRNQNSRLCDFSPEIILVYLATEKLYEFFLGLSDEKKKTFAQSCMDEIECYWDMIVSNFHARTIQCNFTELNDKVYGNYSCKIQTSFIFQIRKLNYLLQQKMQERDDVFPLDLLSLQVKLGAKYFFDENLYYNSKMSISIDALPFVAESVTKIMASLSGQIKKCMILDLDNTLWGGVIGDDGIEGIQIGEYGTGHIYSNLQLYFKQLKDAGIILCVCSKNNEKTAKEPFEKLTDMILKLSDFAVFIANWDDKAENIRIIQQTLNIGFDSMIFVDDSAFERNLVRSKLPEVEIPELPDNPAEWLSFLQSQNYFETSTVSSENKNRTSQYQEEFKRIKQKQNYSNIDDYLASLEMKAKISEFTDNLYNRISQLTQRSNQFNLRTIRYTPNEIKCIANDNNYRTFYVKLRDQHGDYGLISVLILKKIQQDALFIDTWLMSCRVLNRGVEEYVMNYIATNMVQNGFKRILGEYIPTKKNTLVKNLLTNMGFIDMQNGQYELILSQYKTKKTYIAEDSNA